MGTNSNRCMGERASIARTYDKLHYQNTTSKSAQNNLVTRDSQLGAQLYFIIGYCYQRGKVDVKECDVA